MLASVDSGRSPETGPAGPGAWQAPIRTAHADPDDLVAARHERRLTGRRERRSIGRAEDERDRARVEMAQDLGALLARFGLQTYAKLLEDNAIDLVVLPDLTERDLEQLGIPMGHRKKMLKVIRSLAVEDRISAEPHARALPRPEPERRQLTVMMCDMVGSTALLERFDPEDLKAIMAAYQECCQQVIAEHGGTISRYVGDGIFAYFGYPQADEVDAERAIRAGLEIAHRVDRLAPLQERLQVRVGIATGLVLIGEAPHQVESVFGGAPNLAARLQTVAAPGTVATSDSRVFSSAPPRM